MGTRRLGTFCFVLGLALAPATPQAAAQKPPADKVPIVAVAGCLNEQDGKWMLTAASEPEPSIANGPPAGQPYKGPTGGKNTFQLIGVSEYDLPAHRGQTVLVKGLHIKAPPVDRLNITSVTMIAEACTAK